jgi:hypothetical protein
MTFLKTTLFASLLLAGCAADADFDPQHDTPQGKADQISGNDDPSGVLGNAERRLAKLITTDDVGQSFGVEDDKIPYPDTYWPMIDNGIAVEWLEKDGTRCSDENECDDPADSPLVKLVKLTRPDDLEEAIAWEIKNHGKDVKDVASWFGHCPGWVAGAMLNKPILHPVYAKSNGFGGVEACEEGEADCTKFEIGDINGLSAEAHEGARALFIGARCDTKPEDIERDEFGRIVRNGKGCKGLNAGSMLIVMANRLKGEKKPFAIDAQNDHTTEQIWNQPAFKYTVNAYKEISEVEAANLVASGELSGDQTEYQWNDRAKGFAFVDFSLHWITETPGPNLTVVSGASSSRTTRMVAVIELDAPFADESAEIIGGEYIDDARVGANRLRVAPFVWIAQSMGSDWRHNPFVSGSAVQKLIDLGGKSGDVDPTDLECAHDLCSQGSTLEATCDSCVADVCAADSYCCDTAWDNICVGQVESICGQTCN